MHAPKGQAGSLALLVNGVLLAESNKDKNRNIGNR
jgi:hypothetical protein